MRNILKIILIGILCNVAKGGRETDLKQYPWLVLLERQTPYKSFRRIRRCSGSLISSMFVLTAAHCFFDSKPSDEFITKLKDELTVVLGDYNLRQDGVDCVENEDGETICADPVVRIKVSKIFYAGYGDDQGDMAMVKMKEMAPYTEYIRPICLPTFDLTESNHPGLMLTVAGWGVNMLRSNKTRFKPSIIPKKQHVQVPFIQHEQCTELWNSPRIICAGGELGKGDCFGDGGAPLMYKNGNQYTVVGISSRAASPCGSTPSAYTNVYQFDSAWIRNWMATERDLESYKESAKGLELLADYIFKIAQEQ